VAHREGRWFANEIARDTEARISRHGKVERLNVKVDKKESNWRKIYFEALSVLEKEVREGRG
jgi:ATP-dependent RNA helicase DDX51/DBP6